MNIRLVVITLIASLCCCMPLQAQDAHDLRAIYQEAEAEYELGRIEQSRQLLTDHLDQFKGNLLESVYRLLALCALADDDDSSVEEYANHLLQVSPYYSVSAQDPPRFADIVEELRVGQRATITTASIQQESLNEVPVPTTLITEEMIRNSGATNLQEVLAAYVPGMHAIDCNDDINISMRGVYSNGQEKILIMLNGHRLNNYVNNVAAPDYSMSLEKLKQIEVLRGPASSLYGGVALTAVVNLITKEGAEANGLHAKAGIGNYGQLRGDILFGKHYLDLDLLVWGSLYSSKGQTTDAEERHDIYSLPHQSVTIGRAGNQPSYDFGIQLGYKHLKFLFNTHFSQIVAPFGMTTLATPYNWEGYRTFRGMGPSFASNNHHARLSYDLNIGSKFTLQGIVGFDKNDLTHYQNIYDGPLSQLIISDLQLEQLPDSIRNASHWARYVNGQEEDVTVQINGLYNYVKNDSHEGSLAFGIEFNHFKLEDFDLAYIYKYDRTLSDDPILHEGGIGDENNYNAFVQVKHKWRSFILNAGMRFDHKIRFNDTRLNKLSPRMALIYLQPKWNLKLSYSKSFVDAPYLYRKSNILLNPTSSLTDNDVSAETLHSVQLTFGMPSLVKGLDLELNGYYNLAKDLIITHIFDYVNAGKNESYGLEFLASYKSPKFRADFNLNWHKTIKLNVVTDFMKEYYAIPNSTRHNNNTPYVTSNLVLGWRPIKNLNLHSHLCFESKQKSYNLDFIVQQEAIQLVKQLIEDPSSTPADYEYLEQLLSQLVWQGEMPARLICNIGAEYKLGNFTLGLNIRNLFNTSYNRSGMNTKLVPQKGLWFMGSIAYDF